VINTSPTAITIIPDDYHMRCVDWRDGYQWQHVVDGDGERKKGIKYPALRPPSTSTHSLPINPPTTLNQPPNQPTNTFKMQFTNFAFVAFAAFASAAAIDKRAVLCGSANSTPQCCETSVLGVATLSCAARK
jgi:hypothetical protein